MHALRHNILNINMIISKSIAKGQRIFHWLWRRVGRFQIFEETCQKYTTTSIFNYFFIL